MLTIAYSGKSAPSALTIKEQDEDITLYRESSRPVDVNWGRNVANSQLNPDISNVTNKRLMRQLFKEHEVPMPYLYDNTDFETLQVMEAPVIGRPDRHSKGRGLWKCQNIGQIILALRGTPRKKAATHFMEFISKERAPREYRVHIFKGKSIRISEKDFDNDGAYTTAKPQHNIKHVRKAAKKAVTAVGLDFGAVDILANDEDCWVLEVNAAPGLGGSMPRLYAETFRKWKNGEWDEE